MNITVTEITEGVETYSTVVGTSKAAGEYIQQRVHELGLTLDICLYLSPEGEQVKFPLSLELTDNRQEFQYTKGGKMTQDVGNTESSVTERVVIIAQLEEMAEQVEQLDQLPLREALDTLDAVIEDCKEALTNLEQLKEWANQPTEGVKIPF